MKSRPLNSHQLKTHQLFRRSRTRLALWYASVMAVILSVVGFSLYRALVQSHWAAMEREIESIAGTLHDSLEPMLPTSEEPTAALRRILPELCMAGQRCNVTPTLIQRHTMGISDRSTYGIRLFTREGKLLAFSPNLPSSLPEDFNATLWQTFHGRDDGRNDGRYHQFTTILHSAHTHSDEGYSADQADTRLSWGYLQIGRTLAPFDAETRRIQWAFVIGLPLAIGSVVVSSWWLSGLAMQPIYLSYQQQQQFTANTAHELRSPLASLLATVEATLRVPQSNPQDTRTMLHKVERQGRRLSDLIADLLLLTSLEQNSSTKPFQLCCLNDLMADLTEEFSELATGSAIRLNSQIPSLNIYALGNESQLYRLVSNLMANAIQYTPEGGNVVVSLTGDDRTASIAVQDTGIGIASTERTRIFERFYRTDGARSRETGGTGLGLAIAQAIAQQHQAHLRVKSEPGLGSLFTVHLPCIHPGKETGHVRKI